MGCSILVLNFENRVALEKYSWFNDEVALTGDCSRYRFGGENHEAGIANMTPSHWCWKYKGNGSVLSLNKQVNGLL